LNTSKIIKIIESMKKSGKVFSNYIDYIRFPFYKNLEKNTKIIFDFPLTVFVGQNGGGKSSALQALYGAPHGQSVGNFWFSTIIDKIEESEDGDKPSLIYSYQNKEVLKSRVGLKKGFDYWEPSRPIKKYGMKMMGGKRNPAIKKNVLHIDFKSILSAFDKYLYFDTHYKKLKAGSPQSYLRDRSIKLNNAIHKDQIYRSRSGEINEKAIELSDRELKIMSEILGRKYQKGIIIHHNFFHNWGTSVMFHTAQLNYSEAFAGSGEMAVAATVNKIINTPAESLILLDEPEVSLHPGAQQKLKVFLLNEIKEKKHQIIISTHSPNIIENLPSNCIKVFSQLPNGKIHIGNSSTPSEAFYFIGQKQNNIKTIIVEDSLAKELLDSIIKSMGDQVVPLFSVEFFQGGATMMKKQIAGFLSESDKNKFIFFDGDQDTGVTFDPKVDLTEENRTSKFLKDKICEVSGMDSKKIPFSLDGDLRTHPEVYVNYLKYWNSNVLFLPKKIPEELIWDDKVADRLKDNISSKIMQCGDYKDRFVELSKKCLNNDTPSSQEILTIQRLFLTQWIEKKDKNYTLISNYLKKIMT